MTTCAHEFVRIGAPTFAGTQLWRCVHCRCTRQQENRVRAEEVRRMLGPTGRERTR